MRSLLVLILLLPIPANAIMMIGFGEGGPAHGFITHTPDARYGNAVGEPGANIASAVKFTVPDTGTKDVNEIGIYVAAVVSTTCTFRLAIFSDDSGNNNPDTMVLNSQSAELSHSTTTLTKVSNAYGTKPQVTGGSVYWLAYLTSNGNCQFDKLSQASPVINVYYWATTYPTWPSAAQWDSGADSEEDGGVYAIYQ